MSATGWTPPRRPDSTGLGEDREQDGSGARSQADEGHPTLGRRPARPTWSGPVHFLATSGRDGPRAPTQAAASGIRADWRSPARRPHLSRAACRPPPSRDRTALSRKAPKSVTPGDFYLRGTSPRSDISRTDLHKRESGCAQTDLRRPEKSPFVTPGLSFLSRSARRCSPQWPAGWGRRRSCRWSRTRRGGPACQWPPG